VASDGGLVAGVSDAGVELGAKVVASGVATAGGPAVAGVAVHGSSGSSCVATGLHGGRQQTFPTYDTKALLAHHGRRQLERTSRSLRKIAKQSGC
jgi:hypothetical protein